VLHGLSIAERDRDPVELFGEWFDTAERCGIYLPEAVTLATCTRDAIPSARMVLMKGFDDRGVTFFTNYGSRKAGEIEGNPNAALVFHWNVLQRQVRLTGRVERISRDESAAYFSSRPRGSRIAAWASLQSRVLVRREDLERAFDAKLREYDTGDVPLPAFWGGYRLRPGEIEFWQGRANRMHDRLLFRREASGWVSEWLYP
jgi:pyridoxamine 5'-phosphate oxidase